MKEKFDAFLKYFDVPGGVILGLFSLEMLAIIAYYACEHKELPATVRDIYLGVVSAFAVHKTASVFKRSQPNETKPD